MHTARIDVFDRLSALADSTRSRLLLLLEGHELTVSELCAILQLPQSTVSRHLKILSDEGWVTSRAEGTSRLYQIEKRLEPQAESLWRIVSTQLATSPAAENDKHRIAAIIAQRKSRSQEFFTGAAADWESVRSQLYGKAPNFAFLGLLNDRWIVGDLGCGSGQLSELIAPFVRRVIAVDASTAMLASARKRLEGVPNVEVRGGELESLPLEDSELNLAVLTLVLHYVAEPPQVLAEVRRVLQSDGRLLIVDMIPHTREEYRQQMGHVWQGFSSEQLGGWLEDAGFRRYRHHALPVDAEAKGPALFVATART